MKDEKVTVGKEMLLELMTNDMYDKFLLFGCDLTFDEIKEKYLDTCIRVDDELLKKVYDNTRYLYDENEWHGSNDLHYPNRKGFTKGINRYLFDLKKLRSELDRKVSDMFDGAELDESFDIKIMLDGRQYTLGWVSQVVQSLMNMIDYEIDENS